MNSCEYLSRQKVYGRRRTEQFFANPNPFAELLFSSQWKWGSQCWAIPKGKSHHSAPIVSQKQEILMWQAIFKGAKRFQNLNPKQKIACTAIHNPQFIITFVKALPQRHSDSLFHLPTGNILTPPIPPTSDSFFEELVGQLRIANLSQSILYFSGAQVMGMRMLDWLNRVSNSKIFQMAQRGRQSEQNILWFNSSAFHPLENWFANQLEISIVTKYFAQGQQNTYLEEFKSYLIRNSKNAELQGLQMRLQIFNSKTAYQMNNLRQRIKEEEQRYNEIKQQELLRAMETPQPQKKRCKRKQKKKNGDKKKQDQLVKQNGKQNFNQIEENQYNKQAQILDPERQPLLKKEEIDNSPILPAQSRDGKDSPGITSPTKEQSSNQHHQIARNSTPVKNTQCQTKPSPPKRKPSASKNLIYVSPKRTRSPQHIRSSGLLQACDIKQKYSEQDRESLRVVEQSSDNNFSQEIVDQRDILNKRRRRKCKKQNQHFREARQTIWNRLITRHLDNLIDQLSIETNALYEIKSIAFERVRVFVQSLYPHASAVLFGSNAIGLSLPNSDVDILLYGLPCDVKEEAGQFLAQIAVQINAMGWVVSCSTYLNAKVPIVKLQIDPSIPFLQTKRKQDLFRVYNPMALYYLDTNKAPLGTTIKVDITINIQGVTSVGYESTVLMKDWIIKIPQIQRLIILFKYILSIRGFNSNFNGGIGSYCLFTMISAYMKGQNNKDDSDLCNNFIRILKWYGQDFDNLSHIVWLREVGPCFVHEDEVRNVFEDGKRSVLRLMDPITSKMMNSSCNEYNNIKAEFRRILGELQLLEISIEDYLKENDITAAEITKIMQTKKGLEKLINKYQTKNSPSIKGIIDRSN